MTIKVFAEYETFKLVGDPRGFTIKTTLRTDYWIWCQDNSIKTEYHGTLNGVDLWYVKNEKDRMFALLKWS